MQSAARRHYRRARKRWRCVAGKRNRDGLTGVSICAGTGKLWPLLRERHQVAVTFSPPAPSSQHCPPGSAPRLLKAMGRPCIESSTLLGRPIVALVDSRDAASATAGMVQHRLGGFEPDAQARDFGDGTWRRGRSGSMCNASKREGGMSSPHTIERQRGIKEAGQQLGVLRERWPLAFPLQPQDVRPLALGIAGQIAAAMGWSLPRSACFATGKWQRSTAAPCLPMTNALLLMARRPKQSIRGRRIWRPSNWRGSIA